MGFEVDFIAANYAERHNEGEVRTGRIGNRIDRQDG
jgi:hypothetical protein